MGLLRRFFGNFEKPQGTMGRVVVAMMNRGHVGIAAWGLSHLDLRGDEHVLDCGCGCRGEGDRDDAELLLGL